MTDLPDWERRALYLLDRDFFGLPLDTHIRIRSSRQGNHSTHLGGILVRGEAILEFARLVDDPDLASELEAAHGRQTRVLALTIPDASPLAALEEQPADLAEPAACDLALLRQEGAAQGTRLVEPRRPKAKGRRRLRTPAAERSTAPPAHRDPVAEIAQGAAHPDRICPRRRALQLEFATGVAGA